jgi:hypothetical protein
LGKTPSYIRYFSDELSQWAANHGINVIPYGRLQKYVSSIDLRSAVHNHVAFKLSFGTTFALAAFMHF